MSTAFTIEALARLQCKMSIAYETMFSNTAITVVIAAKLMKIKNKEPHSLPHGSTLNMFGRVTNTKPGPEPASMPNAALAGKIIKPAIKAARVSKPRI